MRKLVVALVIIAALLVGGFVFATGGTPAREPAPFITAGPIAHRGLWSDSPEAPENSLAAFAEAAANGYAIELDVHLSADGEVMVIHDADIGRMTGTPGLVADMTAAEL
ncbi:MAG: glycerophosphodiester phosphodiesterase family protein, partial [Actinomycetota bacterium]|nr:glycerophosphodiester phosphodiesterase family protein [Actinomycetota bacterium]